MKKLLIFTLLFLSTNIAFSKSCIENDYVEDVNEILKELVSEEEISPQEISEIKNFLFPLPGEPLPFPPCKSEEVRLGTTTSEVCVPWACWELCEAGYCLPGNSNKNSARYVGSIVVGWAANRALDSVARKVEDRARNFRRYEERARNVHRLRSGGMSPARRWKEI